MIKRVYIASSRSIGSKCQEYAREHLPKGFELCDNMEERNIFISVMYDTILKNEFIIQRKCYNFHAGILPKYRGVGIFSWVIINGEKETGITLHNIDKGIDTGSVIAFKKFGIEEGDTAYSLFNKGMASIYELFVEQFSNLLLGEYTSTFFPKEPNSLYTRKMLDDKRNITKLVMALDFPNKEGLYYYDDQEGKVVL